MVHVNKYFVPLKYVSGRDAEQFMRFNISIMPTCVLIDAEGNELGRDKGFLNAVEIVELMDRALSNRGN